MVKLYSTLKSIIGSKLLIMAYLNRVADAPKLSGHTEWDNKTITVAPLSGVDYHQNLQLYHQIILEKIAEDSDAYT